MTNEQKLLAVADAAERLREVRPHFATLAEILGDEEAKTKLGKIDRALDRFTAEARRLKAGRSGIVAGEGNDAMRESERYHAAVAYTREIEDAFHRDLARLGHADDHDPATRQRIEERALGSVRDSYGEHAARRCRRLLEPSPAAADPVSPLAVPMVPR